MCSRSKEQSIISRETIKKFFFSELCLFFNLEKLKHFVIISVIAEDIYLKVRVCVHYPKSNPHDQGKIQNMFFSELCPFLT